MSVDLDTMRARLESERASVQGALDDLHNRHPGSLEDEVEETPFDNHLADSATATVDREIDYSLGESEERILGAIDAALERIDGGSYGLCERCGRAIEPERLDAIPYATLCIEDKRRDERG
jgi:DnaK suppressor protein